MQAATTLPEYECTTKNSLNLTVNLSSCNSINSCVVSELTPSSSHFKIQTTLKGRNRSASIAAMVDCGATALFISRKFIKDNKVRTHLLSHEVPLYNINGSKNQAGSISRFARLRRQVGDTERWHQFLVTDLGPEDVVLGLPWLRTVNPKIDWVGGEMEINSTTEEKNPTRVEVVASNRTQ